MLELEELFITGVVFEFCSCEEELPAPTSLSLEKVALDIEELLSFGKDCVVFCILELETGLLEE